MYMHGAKKVKVICSMIMLYSRNIAVQRFQPESARRIQAEGAGRDVITMGPGTAACYLVHRFVLVYR